MNMVLYSSPRVSQKHCIFALPLISFCVSVCPLFSFGGYLYTWTARCIRPGWKNGMPGPEFVLFSLSVLLSTSQRLG